MLRRFIICLAFLLVAAFSFHEIVSLDVWFHLKAGQAIGLVGHVPRTDPFSFTAADRPYLDSHWLFQVVFYGIYALFGAAGLVVFKTFCLLFTFGLLFRIGYRPSRYLVSVLFLTVCLFNVRERFFIRPEVVSFLLLAAYLYILYRFQESRSRVVFLLPFLQVVWTNSHGLFVLGPFVVGATCIGAALSRRPASSPVPGTRPGGLLSARPFAVLAGVGAACVLACLVSPYGTGALRYALRLATEMGPSAGAFMRNVSELKPVSALGALSLFFYRVLVAAGVVSFVVLFRRIRWERLLLFAAFFYLSLLARRNIALFAIVSMPILVLNTQEALEAVPVVVTHLGRKLCRGLEIVLPVVLASLIFSLVTNLFYVQQRDMRRFGPGLSRLTYPEGAVSFLKAHGVRGRLFNDANLGGYLIWRLAPETKVFVDGRWEVYGESFLKEYLASLNDPEVFDRLARRYGIGSVLLSVDNALAGPLFRSKAWRLVYAGPVAVIFVKDVPENRDLTAEYAVDLDALVPSPAPSVRFPEKEGYAVASLTRRSEQAVYWTGLAGLFARVGRPDLAERSYRHALVSSLYLPEIYYAMGVAASARGDLEAARKNFLRSIALRPRSPLAYLCLGRAFFMSGDKEQALQALQQAVRQQPGLVEAHSLLGTLYGQEGAFSLAEKAFRRAVRLSPQESGSWEGLADSCFFQEKYPEALEIYERLLPGRPDILFKAGVVLYRTGRYQEAAVSFRLYKRLVPGDTDADRYLGSLRTVEDRRAALPAPAYLVDLGVRTG